MNISEMKSEVARLESDLKRARDVLFVAQEAASDVKIGQIFKRTASRGHGRNKKEFEERGRVCRFDRGYHGDIRPILQMLKKDGADGVRRRVMSEYENWQPVTGAE